MRKERAIPYEGEISSTLRWWREHSTTGKITLPPSTTIKSSDALTKYFTGSQVTDSVNHPGWRKRKSASFAGDVGGPFFSEKKYVKPFNPGKTYLRGDRLIGSNQREVSEYIGPFLAISPSTVSFPPSGRSSESSLIAKGATAISRCAPTNPTADLSVFMGEIVKEGIPSITGSTLKKWGSLDSRARRRAIGEEYLNYDFGWMPIMRDLKKLSNAIVHAEDVLSQYERDSNRLIRRGYSFPPEESTVTTVHRSNTQGWVADAIATMGGPPPYTGQIIRERNTLRTQWFKGGFLYNLPKRDDSLRTEMARKVIQAKKLLGLSLTPDTIWNLTPWSWALDWFANTGDVLENVSSAIVDGLVLKYGYMMEHTIVTDTYTFVGYSGFLPKSAVPVPLSFVTDTKVRIKATPYGFGLSWDGFSPRQLATLAALGLSKS